MGRRPRITRSPQLRLSRLRKRSPQIKLLAMRGFRQFTETYLIFALCAVLNVSALAQETDWKRDLAAWRAQYAANLQKPDGWLSLTGLEWLQPGDNTFGSSVDNRIHLPAVAPAHLGVLHLEGETLQLLPPSAGFPQDFLVNGAPAKPQSLRADLDNDKNSPHLTIASLNLYVIRRADRFALRIKDSQSPALTGFHGLRWYAPDINYRVKAHWIPFSPFKQVSMATLVGTTLTHPAPGAAEFTIGGEVFRLEPVLEEPDSKKLFFILRDTTSATTTYGACRFLYTEFPDHGLFQPGELILDFNRLENPPCAYTPFATCPLPPPQNRLPIALPVGEQRYHD